MDDLLKRRHSLRTFMLAEETTSVVRHDLRNRLAAIRNAAFYLRRRTSMRAPELWAEDPRMEQMFGLVDTELSGAEHVLASRLPEPSPTDDVDVAGVCRALVAAIPPRRGVTVAAEIEPATARGRGDELDLALSCLLDNALDAVGDGGAVSVRCAATTDGGALVTITDDGVGFPLDVDVANAPRMWTTKPDRLGVGLSIVRRLLARAAGTLVLERRPRGTAMVVSLQRPSERMVQS